MAWSKVSRHKLGYGTAWVKLRLVILQRDGYLCLECKRKGFVKTANQVDHIISKALHGTDDESNLQSLCKPCHVRKTIEETGKTFIEKVGADIDGWPID